MPTPKMKEDAIALTVKAWNDGLHTLGMRDAAAKLKIDRNALRRRLDAARANGVVVAAADGGKQVARSLSDFRSEHDKSFIVPRKVRAALETIGSGWLYEVEFAKLAGVGLADLGHFRSQFEENVVAIRRDGGKRAWARKDVAAKMREMVS